MSEAKFEIITLNWIKISDTINIDYIKQKLNNPNERVRGVYQVYGTSPLYGIDTLLYIGMSDTNIWDRIHRHFSDNTTIGKQPNKTIRFAEINYDETMIKRIEDTLIVMYKPSFNSSTLNDINPTSKNKLIYIQNHGERGMLNYENTNYYFGFNEQ